MEDLKAVTQRLVAANRILAAEGVVDAFGHVSVRHPGNPKRYLLSRSRSPELVEMGDIMEFEMDGVPLDAKGRLPYNERFIHGAIYESRPDVISVVHNHAYEVIPFSVSKTPLRPIFHCAGPIGSRIPIWDIREKFGDTRMLVENMEQGRDLAGCLAENSVALMRGHGCVVTGPSIEVAVLTAIYLRVNARLQMDAMQLGEVTYLTPGEIDLKSQKNMVKLGADRAWEYLCSRARVECDSL
jgi:HCOMODA/2-hydroxy-3-carboxy-muconic semialdehyde decarboxylase